MKVFLQLSCFGLEVVYSMQYGNVELRTALGTFEEQISPK